MAVLLTGSVLLAGGCDSTMSPIQVAPGCPDRPMRGPEQWAATPATQTIDDFESGDGRIAREEGRDGVWSLSTDPNDPDAVASTAGPSSRCVARGLFSVHFVTTSPANWGAM
jgi:hypothetical protein